MCASRLPMVWAQPFRACVTSLRTVAASPVWGVGVAEAEGVGVCLGVAVGVGEPAFVVLLLPVDGPVPFDVALVELLLVRGGSVPPLELFLSFRISQAPRPPTPRSRTVATTVTATTDVVLRCFGGLAAAAATFGNSLTV